jgi:predicted CoA-binding protein
VDGAVRIIAAASYTAVSADCAEAAFAVADTFQGKGLGTLLLERLAALAERAGIRRFQATTLASNTQMLEVFRDSGFEIRSKLAGSAVDVEFALASSVASVAAGEKRQRIATAASLRPLFEPQAVAVIGASRNPSNIGRRVLDSLIAAGYRGHVYALNPHTSEIAGLKAFGSARELPAGVDLAVVAVPALSVGQVVDDCAAAGVKALVVVTAGFAEAGSEGRPGKRSSSKKHASGEY